MPAHGPHLVAHALVPSYDNITRHFNYPPGAATGYNTKTVLAQCVTTAHMITYGEDQFYAGDTASKMGS